MNFYNKVLDKKGLKRIVSWFIENYGPTRTSLLLDEFKYIGFHYAGKAGLSLGFDDLRIPPTKKNLLAAAQQQVQSCEKTYLMGRITAFERYQKLIDIWTTTSEKLKDEVIQNFEKIQGGPLASPLYMMAFSGARGNISQVRQLVGMRGLMSDSGGGIIDFPIRSNFREGLSVTEYVISCYGARKGLIDTALRTADSGYLTRRLVDVAHGIIIREIDCGSVESISMKISDTKNLIGRVLAETVKTEFEHKNPQIGEKANVAGKSRAIWRNQEISVSILLELKNLKGPKASIQVRSPLTCLSQSVCQLCYGWNLAQGRLVSLGEAVGILAAQSIGEPGTQLTMRTFHTGGIFSTEVEDKLYSPQDGYISLYRGEKRLEEDRTTNKQLFRGCKVRSVHGQTGFFFFDSIQLKIKSSGIDGTSSAGTQPGLTKTFFAEQDARGPSPSIPEKESILELPAQSILFISPGNKIGKNTLFAEISRIKQPAEKLYDKNSAETYSKNQSGGNASSSSNENNITKQVSVSSPGNGVSVNPPAALAHKKVFSEIEGEVIEKTFPNFLQPHAEENRGGGRGLSLSPPADGTKFNTVHGRHYDAKKQKTLVKSRVVLAGEPFVFKRKKIQKRGPELHGRGFPHPPPFLVKEPYITSKGPFGKDEPRTGANETQFHVAQLPFRTGDIVFWRGKRKFNTFRKSHFTQNNQKSGRNITSLPELRGGRTSSPTLEIRRMEDQLVETDKNTPGKVGVPRPSFPIDTNIAKSKHFTSRSLSENREQNSKNGESTLILSNPRLGQIINKKLTYSGLVLHFEHQKEREHFCLQPRTVTSESFETEKTKSVTTKTHHIGDIFQPYVTWGVSVEVAPFESKTRKDHTFSSDQISNNSLPGLNIPTQIIRKRKNKVILRHVQIHLGADVQTTTLTLGSVSDKMPTGTSSEEVFSEGGRGSRRSQSSRVAKNLKQKRLLPSGNGSLSHYVKQRDLLFQLVLPISQSSSSSDIVQGLPKIEQLFEARTRTLEARGGGNPSLASLAQSWKTSEAAPPPLGKQGSSLISQGKKDITESQAQLLPRSEDVSYSQSKASLRNLQKRLIQEIQSVYNSQGVDIADKHLEIIVRQMTSRIRVLEKGNTPFFPDDIVSGILLNPPSTNSFLKDKEESLAASGGHPAEAVFDTIPSYEWVLMGITKVALLATTESYISAASFQETKRVLMNSALQNRVDFFEGLKENVIVGRMIPAGTGYSEFL